MKKIYNIVCDNEKQKHALIRYYAEVDDVRVVDVAGYFDKYILYVQIDTSKVDFFTVDTVTNHILTVLEEAW